MLHVMSMLIRKENLGRRQHSTCFLSHFYPLAIKSHSSYFWWVLDPFLLCLLRRGHNLLDITLVPATPRSSKHVVTLLDGLALLVLDFGWHCR